MKKRDLTKKVLCTVLAASVFGVCGNAFAEDYEIEDLGIAKAYGLDVLIKVMGEALPEELMDTLQNLQIVSLEEKSAEHRQW